MTFGALIGLLLFVGAIFWYWKNKHGVDIVKEAAADEQAVEASDIRNFVLTDEILKEINQKRHDNGFDGLSAEEAETIVNTRKQMTARELINVSPGTNRQNVVGTYEFLVNYVRPFQFNDSFLNLDK